MASWWIVEQEGLVGASKWAFGRYLDRPSGGAALERPSWWVNEYKFAHRFTRAEADRTVHELQAAIAAHLPAHRAVGLVPLRDVRVRAVEVDESTQALLDFARVE